MKCVENGASIIQKITDLEAYISEYMTISHTKADKMHNFSVKVISNFLKSVSLSILRQIFC